MSKTRKLLALAAAAALVAGMSVTAWATEPSAPVLEGSVFYANGTPITVKDNPAGDGALITWGTDGSLTVPENVSIVGGGKAGTSYASSSIKVEGGVVSTIYGGGDSDDNQSASADVGTATIEMSGGEVTNAIYGGGRLSSTVNSASITVTGGTAQFVMGGGGASAPAASGGSVGSAADHGATSPNHTKSAKINISNAKVDYVMGGGQGYSRTDSASITVGDGADITELIGSGSNGTTGKASITVDGGDVDLVFTVNRGSVTSQSTININGGTVNRVSAGSDPTSVQTTGVIADGGSVTVNIASDAQPATVNLGTGTANAATVTVTGAEDFKAVPGGTDSGNTYGLPKNLVLGSGTNLTELTDDGTEADVTITAKPGSTVAQGVKDALPEDVTVVAGKDDKPSHGASSKDEETQADREADYWENVKSLVENAADGETIRVNAKEFDNVPYDLMLALKGRDVTLVIQSKSRDDISINGKKVAAPEAGRVYYPLDLLAKTYTAGSSGPVANPDTGAGSTAPALLLALASAGAIALAASRKR